LNDWGVWVLSSSARFRSLLQRFMQRPGSRFDRHPEMLVGRLKVMSRRHLDAISQPLRDHMSWEPVREFGLTG
jgi:hypothetical protein